MNTIRNKFFSPLLFVLLGTTSLFAQNKYDFAQFFRETGWYYTQPLRWDAEDWYKFGFTSAATGIAYIIEPRPKDVAFLQAPFYNSIPAVWGRRYGEPYIAASILGAYAAYSVITGDKTTTKIAFELAQTLTYAGVVTTALKQIIGRARPYTDEGKASFRPVTTNILDDAHHSLPSGHVTVAFAVSTVLSLNADPLWLKILAYVPAFFTPFSRAYQGFHWISDCALAAGIGYFTGKWVHDTHDRADQKSEEKSAIQVTSIYPFSVSVALK